MGEGGVKKIRKELSKSFMDGIWNDIRGFFQGMGGFFFALSGNKVGLSLIGAAEANEILLGQTISKNFDEFLLIAV